MVTDRSVFFIGDWHNQRQDLRPKNYELHILAGLLTGCCHNNITSNVMQNPWGDQVTIKVRVPLSP